MKSHSLKLKTKAPRNFTGPKRRVVFQPSMFRGYVSFREGSKWDDGMRTVWGICYVLIGIFSIVKNIMGSVGGNWNLKNTH